MLDRAFQIAFAHLDDEITSCESVELLAGSVLLVTDAVNGIPPETRSLCDGGKLAAVLLSGPQAKDIAADYGDAAVEKISNPPPVDRGLWGMAIIEGSFSVVPIRLRTVNTTGGSA